MKNDKIGILLIFFMTILIGIILLSSLSDSIYLATTISGYANESIAMSSGTAETATNESITMTSQEGTVANCGVIAITFFGNGTNSSHLASVAIGTQVNITGFDQGILVSATHFPGDGDYNISYTYSDRAGSTAQDDLTTVTFFGNGTNSSHLASVAIGTQVNWTKAGAITASSCHFSDGTYNISYNYEGDEYITNITAQTLIILIKLFFAIAIIIVGYLYVKRNFEDLL